MVENFEEITVEMTTEEHQLVPPIMKILRTHGISNPIKGRDIVQEINGLRIVKFTFTEPRLRKVINYLRSNKKIPVIANSRGYFVSNDTKVIESQIRSLTDRASGIQSAASGLQGLLSYLSQGLPLNS